MRLFAIGVRNQGVLQVKPWVASRPFLSVTPFYHKTRWSQACNGVQLTSSAMWMDFLNPVVDEERIIFDLGKLSKSLPFTSKAPFLPLSLESMPNHHRQWLNLFTCPFVGFFLVDKLKVKPFTQISKLLWEGGRPADRSQRALRVVNSLGTWP